LGPPSDSLRTRVLKVAGGTVVLIDNVSSG
jgi:hypothetical protein